MEDKLKNNHGHLHNEGCCDSGHVHAHGSGTCACEGGMLKNIDNIEEKSNEPLYIIFSSIILFLIGFYIYNFIDFSFGNLVILNFSLDISSKFFAIILFILVVLISGLNIIKEGIYELFEKEIKIEFLVTIATIGAFVLGDFIEAACLMLLFFIAEYLEEFSLDKSKKSLINIVKLAPDTATIKKDGVEVEVNVEDISIGDIVIAKPGDKIAIDGEIINGSSSINQASITGESIPVFKTIGDEVYSSTINQEGYLEFKATKKSDDTLFAKIIELIKESDDKKAKIDLFVDKFARYYTPFIVLMAILVAIIPLLLFNCSLNESIYKALVLLVISCPCAFAISTPVSMVSAITAGTRNGIIIKGGEYIEELAKIKAISFDKTGTLTEGNLVIDEIKTFNNFDKEELMKIICSIENMSTHPIAKSFTEFALVNNISLKKVDNFKSISGFGLVGDIGDKTYKIGKKEGFDLDLDDLDVSYVYPGSSIFISEDNNLIGFIRLSDKIRDDGRNTITKLHNKKIKTFMLTGDNEKIASTVSKIIGLDDYYSNLLPEDKVNIIKKLVKEYDDLAMVGDGVNDSPALAQANVGIAMGLNGSDIAIETSDIVLIDDDISKINYLIELSKKTMGVVKQNISFSVIVKFTLAILGVIGFLSLGEAIVFGDVGLTLVVVANALRISRNS